MATGAELWSGVELDAWGARPKKNRGARPTARIRNSWTALNAADKASLLGSMQAFRGAQAADQALATPLDRDWTVLVEVQAWLTEARAKLATLQNLMNTAVNLSNQRDQVQDGNRQHTVNWLGTIVVGRQTEWNALNGQVPIHDNERVQLQAAQAPISASDRRRQRAGDLSSAWSPIARDLDSGGITQLWCKQDAHQLIIDRIVIKEAHYDADENGRFDKTQFINGIPTEVSTMQALRPLQGSSETVVKLRNWRYYPFTDEDDRKKCRLYLEYCGGGDLEKFVRLYGDYWVPEPFAWSVFENLAKAGILMERGDLTQGAGPGDWAPIVHRDLKPANVFLSTEPSTEQNAIYRGYPSAKIGDFGIACYPNTPNTTVADYQKLGTEGYIAREQEVSNFRVSEKTNVWGAGIVMYSLLTSRAGAQNMVIDEEDDGASVDDEPEAFNEQEKGEYSETLLDLITSCVAYSPDDRPTFDALLQSIRNAADPTLGDLARGLREQPDPRHATFIANGLRLREEQYKLLSIFPDDDAEAPVPRGAQGGTTDDYGGLEGQPIGSASSESSSSESSSSESSS